MLHNALEYRYIQFQISVDRWMLRHPTVLSFQIAWNLFCSFLQYGFCCFGRLLPGIVAYTCNPATLEA